MTTVGITKESVPGETRVAATPETVAKMINKNMVVLVESGAGLASYLDDKAYEQAGATIKSDRNAILQASDIILKVNRPLVDETSGRDEVAAMKEKAMLIAPLFPSRYPELMEKCAAKKITAFALERLPRIARAQSMDILSSMSNIAGYKSVILAADHLPKMFPMMTTAAGTILPAKIIVIGAGVAGLQAIATARRLGGVVITFDTRPVAAEQVKSLGADFVSLETSHEQAQDEGGYAKEQSADFYKNEQAIIQKYSKEADVIITTALIPNKRAPLLISENMVKEMKPGSVIVDLSIEQGGNCALSELGNIIVKHQVTIIGIPNMATLMPVHASQLYSKNLFTFLSYIQTQMNAGSLDLNDDITKACLVTYQGEIMRTN
jgi:H+-translocating NAD(P) transhydrogenase subunit alpha